jgi:hypothetical protein
MLCTARNTKMLTIQGWICRWLANPILWMALSKYPGGGLQTVEGNVKIEMFSLWFATFL